MVFTSIVWVGYVLSLVAGYFGVRWLWHSACYLMESDKEAANRHRAMGKRMGQIHGRLFIGVFVLVLLGFPAACYGL